jgi:hypothetical protein
MKDYFYYGIANTEVGVAAIEVSAPEALVMQHYHKLLSSNLTDGSIFSSISKVNSEKHPY